MHQHLPRKHSVDHESPTTPHPLPRRSSVSSVHNGPYFANLRTPTLTQIADIARMQEEKEKEVQSKYAVVGEGDNQEIFERERLAAGTIQV